MSKTPIFDAIMDKMIAAAPERLSQSTLLKVWAGTHKHHTEALRASGSEGKGR